MPVVPTDKTGLSGAVPTAATPAPGSAGGVSRREAIGLGAGLATAAGLSQGAAAATWLSNPAARRELLSGIDTIVVLMMENRSFDHFYGDLANDPSYPGRHAIRGRRTAATNRDADGNEVPAYHLRSPVQSDPPHTWEACHQQWGNGKNDGFVQANAGAFQQEVMGYFQRSDLPFSYWLADQYTVCDQWFASVMGPTWPNRAVLHAATAAGMKSNIPFLNPPTTIWENLSARGISAKNYFAGSAPFFAGAFLGKVLQGVNPTAPIDDFFADAKAGTLPSFSIIDPDFAVNDDHPSHSVALGQAFIASVYQALAQGPQWERCLFVLTYDEHGGFYDQAPPPQCQDSDPEYRTLGFRVPAVVAGPSVRKGAVCSTVLEHASIANTLGKRFAMDNLSPRMAGSNDLSVCLDPDARFRSQAPTVAAPRIELPHLEDVLTWGGVNGQVELAAMEANGDLLASTRNPASREERTRRWLLNAEKLGAIRLGS